ncbi:restriction endonuclease subunit S [Empedobacter falsenii]
MGRLVKFKVFLKRSKIPIELNDDETYKRVTIRIKHGGVSLRDTEVGKKIGTKKQFILKEGQFIVSKIDARYGAFGIAPNEVNDAIITGNFWAYDVDFNIIDIDWFNQFTNSQYFYDLCERASSGITHRKYLSEESFLNNEINLPSLEEQKQSIAYINNLKESGNSISTEITHQLDLIKNLRQAFLREAMQGVLVSNETSDNKTGADLLVEIQAEKNQLVKEKKIKKPKTLAPITDEEIIFDIPENWTWCRLGEVIELKSGQDLTPSQYNDKGIGIPYITGASNLENEEVIINRWTETPKSIAEKGELLITCKGTIGKMTVLQIDKVHIARQLMSIRDIYSINIINYIQNILRLSINSFQERSKSLIPGIDRDMVLNEIIPLPPLAIQERIVAKLDELMGYCDALEEQVKQSQQTNELLLQQVLREALGA